MMRYSAFLLFVLAPTSCNVREPDRQLSQQTLPAPEVLETRIGVGCVALPSTQRVVTTSALVDAEYGYIEDPGRTWRIEWCSGSCSIPRTALPGATANPADFTYFWVDALTKTFAATLIMQLVEEGKLDLDEPMSHYSSEFKDDSVRVKHLLSHTSDGTPGERYQYSGNRYDYLTAVIEKKTGKSFRESGQAG